MRIQPPRRRARWIILSVVVLILLFFGGRYFLLSAIRSALYSRLDDLKKKGIAIKFQSVDVNAWTGDIQIHNLNIALGDTLSQKVIRAGIPYLLVKGIEIVPYITNRNISIRSVSLTQPSFTIPTDANVPESGTGKSFFENLYIRQISIISSVLHVKDTLGQDTIANVFADVNVRNFGMEKMVDSLAWRDSDVQISNFSFNFPNQLYAFAVKAVRLDLNERTFEIDSLKISPTTGRRAFMKKYGREIDYIQGVVPSFRIDGLSFRADPRFSILADIAKLNFHLEVYRDKRLPFKKDHFTSLPIHYLQRLPIHLKVDTIRITDSFVSYEEYPEKGDSAGGIFFDKMNVTIAGLDNDPALKQSASMNAYTKFMGGGDLNAAFHFPGDTTRPYKVTGTLKNFSMMKLNSMLGPAAKVRVESGTMTNFKFNFQYTPLHSDGTVELNYEDLKISSLRKNNKNEQAVSLIKTLLLNTLIIKKDMDEDMTDDEKTGTVSFYRDRKKSIFNYWTKSLLSGIKSAYKLDKLQNALQGDKKKPSASARKRDHNNRKRS